MSKIFRAEKHSTIDKSFRIIPPDDFEVSLIVDFDDVWHSKVNKDVRWVVKVLNEALKEKESK